MASRLEQDLSCPICLELFTDPVVLCSNHGFCKLCLENWWKNNPKKTCPVCRTQISYDPLPSTALRNLVETFIEEREQRHLEQISLSPAQPVCRIHSKELCFFCLDDQDLVCLFCLDSRSHSDSFILIEEAAHDLREQLRNSIQPLQDQLKVLDQRRAQFDSAAAHISTQAVNTQAQLKAQFKKLHQFLIVEEESRLKNLKDEEDRLTQRMKDKIAAVSRDMEVLSQTISETEEQLRSSDASFLLQYQTSAERVQRCSLMEEPEIEPESLLDQAKHLGNLDFNIWKNMKSVVQFYPVLLDPNTAGPGLVLSEDLSSVRHGEVHELPENPERFSSSSILGSEEFASGTHDWDVEVGENTRWTVGVCGSVQREEDTEEGFWCVRLTDGKYSGFSHSGLNQPLSVTNLRRVRVKLDFDSETVTFTDPETNTDLLTVTDTFSEGLTPYLVTINGVPLKILPKDISIPV